MFLKLPANYFCDDSVILLIHYSNGLRKAILMLVTVHNYVNQCRTKKYAAGLVTYCSMEANYEMCYQIT